MCLTIRSHGGNNLSLPSLVLHTVVVSKNMHMYMYMYLYLYTYMYMCMYICMHIYMYMCMCMYLHIAEIKTRPSERPSDRSTE